MAGCVSTLLVVYRTTNSAQQIQETEVLDCIMEILCCIKQTETVMASYEIDSKIKARWPEVQPDGRWVGLLQLNVGLQHDVSDYNRVIIVVGGAGCMRSTASGVHAGS